MSFICPVCGFPGLKEEPHPKTGGASDEICPSCFFQFGFDDDDRGISYEDWRAQWVRDGMPWRGKALLVPRKWDPQKQLENLKKE
jgi:hypothetical protein